MRMRRERNVFDDLGFSGAEARVLKMKADLHSKIIRRVKHYTQAQLQTILGEPQPRISDLLRGKISKFSLETLIHYADLLQMHPEIRTHNAAASSAAANA